MTHEDSAKLQDCDALRFFLNCPKASLEWRRILVRDIFGLAHKSHAPWGFLDKWVRLRYSSVAPISFCMVAACLYARVAAPHERCELRTRSRSDTGFASSSGRGALEWSRRDSARALLQNRSHC